MSTQNQPSLAEILAEAVTAEDYQKRLQELDYDPKFEGREVVMFSKYLLDTHLDGDILSYDNNFTAKHHFFKLARITFLEKALFSIEDKNRRYHLRKIVDVESELDETDLEILSSHYRSSFGENTLFEDINFIEQKINSDYKKCGVTKLEKVRDRLITEHDKERRLINMSLDIINNSVPSYFLYLEELKEDYS